ncbi:DUF177 domain-containing protein [Alsobacter sp. SYSU M60028]|uniref:DUF177 domain-containing protein n=1 Tax=Alsobacter ponti TaxID=2962936 RepID=A0ABT1LA35_9HYPH|nr:DUF177 domain-containing protein [Alsobacter ponti]MCP8938347.1 DUF177 domain-containing protein [Alsobacter ponti]
MTETPILSRLVKVDDIPGGQIDVTIEASEQERAALARDFGLVEIARLVGRYRVERRGRYVHVTGRVEATIEQTCVVTLEPFAAEIGEDVDLRYTEPHFIEDQAEEGEEHEVDLDAPDPIENGRVDLGALTAEILSLGLDPYPRKPGASFAFGEPAPEPSPFAKLASLKKTPEE